MYQINFPNYVAKAILWVYKNSSILESLKKKICIHGTEENKILQEKIEQSTYSPHYFL
jgi:hypothetical protein